jgi:hypothetical protein
VQKAFIESANRKPPIRYEILGGTNLPRTSTIAGRPLKTAQENPGHSEPETALNVYTHAIPEPQKRAVEKAGKILFRIVPRLENRERVAELTDCILGWLVK